MPEKTNFNTQQKKALLAELILAGDFDLKTYQQIIKKFPSFDHKIFSKSELIAQAKTDKVSAELIAKMQMKPTRTMSGVTPVTVLTKPWPCPGKCIFCPTDVRMPKSYLKDEPGAQRAFSHRFSPYDQVASRLRALQEIGHPTDKVELIILGGTWSFYPEEYQIWFVRECFRALNTWLPSPQAKPTGEGRGVRWIDLEAEQKINETAPSRCVGLVIETRPDYISEAEVIKIRRLGATKVQIGVQSLNDQVLQKNQRGHSVAATAKAFALLRQAGFKIHAHWMANLYGATPEADQRDFKKLFSVNFRPDELKIYPCSLIKSAELYDYYLKKLWQPYDYQELLSVMTFVLQRTPRYCRITRMIRDFSSHDIEVGNKKTNFRQIAEDQLKKIGQSSPEIRAREIRSHKFAPTQIKFKTTKYQTRVSQEYFLEYMTADDKLLAFLRLSLPTQLNFIPELKNTAMIREIHVYGPALKIGQTNLDQAQHLGLGKKLIARAQTIAIKNNFKKIAVISAVGTREYYRKQGFRSGQLYQHLNLPFQSVRA